MDDQVKETGNENGTERLQRLRKEAKELGITGTMTAEDFEAAIKAKKDEGLIVEDILDTDEMKKIEVTLKYEAEVREKLIRERQIKTDTATIIVESESLHIKIDLPESPTEVDLARARKKLGIVKAEVRPSPETVAIESSKRGYYRFTNREQDDARQSATLGGKYSIDLIPDQIHVLSEFHIRAWDQYAVEPVYGRVPVQGPLTDGDMGETCQRTGGKPRFLFSYLGEAPQNAPFGLVTDTKILEEFKKPLMQVS